MALSVLPVGLVVLSLVAGCAPLGEAASSPPQGAAVIPLAPTPWPSGTVGPYGLRIDPRLLLTFPSSVSGERLVEAADLEVQALDDADLPVSFDTLAAAQIGAMADANWLVVTIAHARPGALTDDFYARWRDDYAAGACSHADGVGSTSQQTIGDWSVDVASCRGGVDAYTLRLENDLLVSVSDLGPRRLGRQLIASLS